MSSKHTTGGEGAPGRAPLYVDGSLGGQADFAYTTLFVLHPGGLICGASGGSPVVSDYKPPCEFTGALDSVTIDLSGDVIQSSEAEMRMAMARQ